MEGDDFGGQDIILEHSPTFQSNERVLKKFLNNLMKDEGYPSVYDVLRLVTFGG